MTAQHTTSHTTRPRTQVVDMPTLVDTALAYAAHGWPVFPCHTPTHTGCSCHQPGCSAIGKHPRTRHGTRDATRDPDVIRSWWDRWPDANLAIATGTPSGLLVIDLDPHHGATSSWPTLIAHHPPFETGPIVATGGGGWHLYFHHPDQPIPNSVARLGPGIDVRSTGGYVIAPPSRHHTSNHYRWHTPPDRPIPNPPGWLTNLCQTPQPPTMSEPIALRECLDRWAHGALRGELDHVRDSVAGTRNTTLNRAAFRLGQLCATGHLDPHETTELLLAAALHTGLTEHEARATITSGLHAGHHHPRTNLPAR